MENSLLTDKEILEIIRRGQFTVEELSQENCQVCVNRVKQAQDAKTLREVKDALSDYANGKISFERLSERLEINFYELHTTFMTFAQGCFPESK